MSKKVVLCADSTCDLSPELKERYGVHTYPFHVSLGEDTYSDGVDLMPDTLEETLKPAVERFTAEAEQWRACIVETRERYIYNF